MLTDKVKGLWEKFLKNEEDVVDEKQLIRKFFNREGISIGWIALDAMGYRSFVVSRIHGIMYSSTTSFDTEDLALDDAIEKANEYYNTRLNHPDNYELEKLINDAFRESNT